MFLTQKAAQKRNSMLTDTINLFRKIKFEREQLRSRLISLLASHVRSDQSQYLRPGSSFYSEYILSLVILWILWFHRSQSGTCMKEKLCSTRETLLMIKSLTGRYNGHSQQHRQLGNMMIIWWYIEKEDIKLMRYERIGNKHRQL